jgi:hypothetical protein
VDGMFFRWMFALEVGRDGRADPSVRPSGW